MNQKKGINRRDAEIAEKKKKISVFGNQRLHVPLRFFIEGWG